ncbi:energy transducer TonB [Formosa sp. PL04]|uniref:energy transducer TonB n=1 Tax=Formosa sp. PL04 TaxID=3081755 RepID=UPI00298151D8|nr:energy transducer TonB [Formosa sp. PL04]MDW5290729.1 energy transducer TonB [Formosa sp. PL04]
MKAKKNPDLEIGRNSNIYFAIGLNLMLFFTWQGLEYRTFETEIDPIEILDISSDFQEDIPVTKFSIPLPPPITVSTTIKVVESIAEIEETVIESTESSQEVAVLAPAPVIEVNEVQVEEVEEDVEVPFAVIENIPVFPGCEGLSNQKAKACFQQKMIEHIKNHFNYPQDALDLGIQGRVSVMFIIDENGNVIGIKSRGPDKILEREAERIVRILPRMSPGLQRGRPVKVSYALPIFFKYKE